MFRDRLAYLRWLWARGQWKHADGAFAAHLGVGTKWYSKWKKSPDAPGPAKERDAIEGSQGREVMEWLYFNKGDAPEPELWQSWLFPSRSLSHPDIPRERDSERHVETTGQRAASGDRRRRK